MIDSLEDAWNWYESVRLLTQKMGRLGAKHWEELPWAGGLGQDEHFKQLTATEIQHRAKTVVADLDDLCVLLLFSVFEAIVRERVLEDVKSELPSVHHPALKLAMDNLKQGLEEGSFFRVLEPFKDWDAGLIEEVNQVRRYRNWVAHGRRGRCDAAVEPSAAFDRLRRFLGRLRVPSSPPTVPATGNVDPKQSSD